MSIYYFLPALSGVLIGTIITVFLTKILGTPKATLLNAVILVAGFTLLTAFVAGFGLDLMTTIFWVNFIGYFLILKVYPVPWYMGLMFTFINFAIGSTVSLVLAPNLVKVIVNLIY